MKSIKRRVDRLQQQRSGAPVFRVTIEDTSTLPDPAPGERTIIVRPPDEKRKAAD